MANRNSENVNKQIADIVADEMNKSVININTNIRRERAYASGRASNSLSTTVTQTATGAKGVIASNVSYFNALETGRGPFKGGTEQGLAERLYEWAGQKGINFSTDRERLSFAYALARKINKVGTQLYRNGGRTTIFSNEKEDLIRRITEKIAPLFNGENDSVEIKFN